MNGLRSERFIEENMGLVHLCANRFKNRGIEYEDLCSAGSIGLIKAADAFDTERGVKFSTYAVPVILGEIKRLFRDGGAIKVSRSMRELSMRITRLKDKFQLEHGREPTISELCAISGENSEDIIEALEVSMPPISLTSSNSDGEDIQIDIAVEAPDNEMNDILSLRQALEILDENDRKLLYLRYFKDMTQSQTAKLLQMTQVQVSRREKKLLMKLRGFLTD